MGVNGNPDPAEQGLDDESLIRRATEIATQFKHELDYDEVIPPTILPECVAHFIAFTALVDGDIENTLGALMLTSPPPEEFEKWKARIREAVANGG